MGFGVFAGCFIGAGCTTGSSMRSGDGVGMTGAVDPLHPMRLRTSSKDGSFMKDRIGLSWFTDENFAYPDAEAEHV